MWMFQFWTRMIIMWFNFFRLFTNLNENEFQVPIDAVFQFAIQWSWLSLWLFVIADCDVEMSTKLCQPNQFHQFWQWKYLKRIENISKVIAHTRKNLKSRKNKKHLKLCIISVEIIYLTAETIKNLELIFDESL